LDTDSDLNKYLLSKNNSNDSTRKKGNIKLKQDIQVLNKKLSHDSNFETNKYFNSNNNKSEFENKSL